MAREGVVRTDSVGRATDGGAEGGGVTVWAAVGTGLGDRLGAGVRTAVGLHAERANARIAINGAARLTPRVRLTAPAA